MAGILIDSNVILDIFENDPDWVEWSESMLNQYSYTHDLCINPIIYAEISIGFKRIEELENAITRCGFKILQIPKEALFLAGKAFIKYRRLDGKKLHPLPDFFIGAHAAINELDLLTRDNSRYKTYFPTVKIISPKKS